MPTTAPPPIVSVLLPARDAAKTIDAALASILHGSLAPIEVVAVDDGSNDSTRERIAHIARRDPRVRLLALPATGIARALNAGLELCRAPLVARMDADDLSHPDRFLLQSRFLERHPEIDVVGCRVDFGGDARAQRGYALHVEWVNSLLSHEQIALNQFIDSPVPHPSAMFRRETILRAGGYRHGSFPEDYDLWLRLLAGGSRIAKLPETLLAWNDPPDRISRVDPRYSPRALFELKARHLAAWLARHNPRHPEITVWGAGRLARRRAELLLPHGVRIARLIDIAPRLIGTTIDGRPVIGPDHIPADAFVVSYVATRGARELIRARLAAEGRVEGAHYIVAA